MNGNELKLLKDHMRDLITGSDKLTKVQFDNIKEDVTEIKNVVKENKEKFDEYAKNHYSFHSRTNKRMYKYMAAGGVIIMVLILSGAAKLIVNFLVKLVF